MKKLFIPSFYQDQTDRIFLKIKNLLRYVNMQQSKPEIIKLSSLFILS